MPPALAHCIYEMRNTPQPNLEKGEVFTFDNLFCGAFEPVSYA